LSNVVPQGMVVFVPSYSYEEQLVARWEETGLLKRIGKRKVVIREPRGAGKLDTVLDAYAKACGGDGGDGGGGGATTGGLLLSVVGGKLSEGINFSDGLARCVVVVGMPYSHPNDPEIVSRMAFLDRTQRPQQQRGTGARGTYAD
jgi:chromosome transmission fidelity protein 1